MTLLYLTADRVGEWTGGGSVTDNEHAALNEFSLTQSRTKVDLISRDQMEQSLRANATYTAEPWLWDQVAYHLFGAAVKLAHLYAGTFTECVSKLRHYGARVAYTAAAHDVEESRKAHQEMGVMFGYPHLTDPPLWERYVRGYREADVVVCPSRHSAECMRRYGCERVFVIPHGVDLPDGGVLRPPPPAFRVGYMGSCAAPDKGLAYLLKAWKKLNYPDASLVLAGHDSASDYVTSLCERAGVTNVVMLGWVKDKANFFNNISLYVQPSVTEGFGLEVLEAMAYGRPAICSVGAGAADALPTPEFAFPARGVDAMCDLIQAAKRHWDVAEVGADCRRHAAKYAWPTVRGYYHDLWKELFK